MDEGYGWLLHSARIVDQTTQDRGAGSSTLQLSASGRFYLSGAEQTINPRKRMACWNIFQCFLSKFCHMVKFNNNKVAAKKATF